MKERNNPFGAKDTVFVFLGCILLIRYQLFRWVRKIKDFSLPVYFSILAVSYFVDFTKGPAVEIKVVTFLVVKLVGTK